MVLQATVNLDNRSYQWVGGLQPQVSTSEYRFLGRPTVAPPSDTFGPGVDSPLPAPIIIGIKGRF